MLASCVRSCRPHVDVVLCLDGRADVPEEDRWSFTADLLLAQEAGAVIYPIQERNPAEAEYERRRGLPEDYEPLPVTPLDPPLACLESNATKLEALWGLATRHGCQWALLLHPHELLCNGEGLRDELRPFYDHRALGIPVGDDVEERLIAPLGVGPAWMLPEGPGTPFIRSRAYLQAPLYSEANGR